MSTPSNRRTVVAVLLSSAVAAGAWVAGAGVAAAPEPAQLTQSLSGSTGMTGAAVFLHSGTDTRVVKWPTSYISVNPLPEAGKPCSPYDLAPYQETTRVIVRTGAYAKCV